VKFQESPLAGVYTIDVEPRGDDRGFFARMFDVDEFRDLELETNYVQFNTSFSRTRHTFRGLHYQLGTSAEVKVIKVIRGELLDVVLDLRAESPTYGRWFSAALSAENRTMMYVPRGCAHGFLTLTERVEMIYFVSAFYDSRSERTIRHDDPQFGIELPFEPKVISAKDAAAPDFNPTWHLGER
jgi:dTDP-4-dehydrorhamnose 3,5-epimerase